MKALRFLLLCPVLAAFGQIPVDESTAVAFGDLIADVEGRLHEKSFDAESARPATERRIATTTVLLEFDTGRLWRATLKWNYHFPQSLRPYPDEWKNFPPLGEHKLAFRMPRADFDAYLQAWEARAAEAGKHREVDYWLRPAGSAKAGEKVTILFAPRRRVVGTGELVGDSATFSFTGSAAARINPRVPEAVLDEVVLIGDAFSRRGRETAESAEAFAINRAVQNRPGAGVTLEDGTRIYFGQPKAEVEKILGTEAQIMVPPRAPTVEPEQRLTLRQVSVAFDHDRLARITYKDFSQPPAPFPEAWKNLTPLGGLEIRPRMTKDEFLAYLAMFEKRLEGRGLVREKHFFVREGPQTERMDSVGISLPPSRPSPDGGWRDTWRALFQPVGQLPNQKWLLTSLEAARGEFITRAPPPAAQRKKQIKEIAGDRPKVEPPKVEPPTLEPVLPKP